MIWTEFFLSQRNVLAFKKDWHLYHQDFLNPNIVTFPILASTYVLNGYQLKSDHDLGLIRLMSDNSIKPVNAEFWFSLQDGGYLDVIFNASPESYKALRLSRSKFYPSGIYESDSTEKYTRFRPLSIPLKKGFQSVTITESKFSFGTEEFIVPELEFEMGQFGFQITPAHAKVLAVKVNDQTLNFLPDGDRFTLYLRHFAILAGIVLILGFLPYPGRVKLSFILTSMGMLFLLWDILIGFQVNQKPLEVADKFRMMDNWWKPGSKTLEEKLKELKKGDSDTVMFLCREKGCVRTQIHVPLPQKKGPRIAIFGGSQSKYALIRKYEESIHFRFDELIRKSIPNIETINISAPGQFPDRLNAFGKYLPNVHIDTIIIESKVAEIEYPAIRRFLEECKKRNVRVILLRTPQNIFNYDETAATAVIPELLKGLNVELKDIPDNYLWLALRNVSFIKETQKEFGFIFLDPNKVFLNPDVMHSGQLFWDRTHMTIHGQDIFAKWLAEEYLKLN